jgi:hypothetical protein
MPGRPTTHHKVGNGKERAVLPINASFRKKLWKWRVCFFKNNLNLRTHLSEKLSNLELNTVNTRAKLTIKGLD